MTGGAVLQGVGSLFDWPWIYVLVALSVVLDVFVPVLPSGVLVVSAATAGSTGAAGEDMVDVLAYRLAFRGGEWFDRRMASSQRLALAHERLSQVLHQGGGGLVILAR